MSVHVKSLEQWARDLLELAIDEELVTLPPEGVWGGERHPQERSAGELVVFANRLNDLLKEDRAVQQRQRNTFQGTWRADGRTIQFDAATPQGTPYVGAPVLATEQGVLERCAPDHPGRIGWLVSVGMDMLCVVMLA